MNPMHEDFRRKPFRMTVDSDPSLKGMSDLMRNLRQEGGAPVPPPAEDADPLRAHAGLVEKLRAMPPVEPSAGFTAQVMTKIQHPARQRFQHWPRVILQSAAMLALLAAAALAFLRGQPNDAARFARQMAQTSRVEAIAAPLHRETPLAYLARTQRADGSWSDTGGQSADLRPRYGAGISALALLAFVNQSPDALQGANAPVIRRGVEHLMAQQSAEGRVGLDFTGAGFNQYLAAKALDAAARLRGAPVAWKQAAFLAMNQLPQDDLTRERIKQFNRSLARADWDGRHWEKVGGPVMVAAITAIRTP